MLQIAICDDEQFYREKLLSLVRQYLEQRDLAYTAQLYASGEQFLAQYENNVKYDIVFMDISMPVMRGDEAAMEIRKIDRKDCRELPVIAMTANALESDVRNSYKCGMNGHISKPIEPEEVYKCLNKWLMGGQAQS